MASRRVGQPLGGILLLVDSTRCLRLLQTVEATLDDDFSRIRGARQSTSSLRVFVCGVLANTMVVGARNRRADGATGMFAL